jgi:hypothetical protein
MLSCKETSLLVSQSLDRGLSWRERWAVRLHLLLCAACARFKRQVEFLRTAAQHGAESLLGLSPTARDRIQHALHRHEQ